MCDLIKEPEYFLHYYYRKARCAGPDVSRSVETVLKRSVLLGAPLADPEMRVSVSHLGGESQESLLREWRREAGRGRQQMKATLASKLPLWVTGA